MTQQNQALNGFQHHSRQAADPVKRLKFDKDNSFQAELQRRVDEFFESTGRRKRDCPEMYLKTAILLVSFAALYGALVFWAQTGWQALVLSVFLGLAAAGIGFNIQHDGSHQAYSNASWVNWLTSLTLELIGASSYNWRWKHTVFHHMYTNITGYDTDLEVGALRRLTPHQPWLPFHRWQAYYLWPLYGVIAIRWQLYDDFHDVLTGRIGNYPYPRPTGRDLITFLAGKALFLTLVFGIPLLFHSFWAVVACYSVSALVLSVVMSVVFQLAHAVEEVEFPLPQAETGRISQAWAIHQAETTVNFARQNRMLSWFLGGLNFQIEHHLFPRICHVNYPAISPIVKQTCQEFGVPYIEHQSVWSGIASHFRWLHRMGRPPLQT